VTRLRAEKREVVPDSDEDKKFLLGHKTPRQALKISSLLPMGIGNCFSGRRRPNPAAVANVNYERRYITALSYVLMQYTGTTLNYRIQS
jgi:hypothetical protein